MFIVWVYVWVICVEDVCYFDVEVMLVVVVYEECFGVMFVFVVV